RRHLPHGRDLLAPPPLRRRCSFFHSRRLRPASLPRPWRGAGAVPRSPVAAPRFSPTAFPALVRCLPTSRPRRTSLSDPGAASLPGCCTALHSQPLDASRRPARNNDAAPRPRRSAREAADTTGQCRGHCARIVVSALLRCVEYLGSAAAPRTERRTKCLTVK